MDLLKKVTNPSIFEKEINTLYEIPPNDITKNWRTIFKLGKSK